MFAFNAIKMSQISKLIYLFLVAIITSTINVPVSQRYYFFDNIWAHIFRYLPAAVSYCWNGSL